jgi:hypothetical protein
MLASFAGTKVATSCRHTRLRVERRESVNRKRLIGLAGLLLIAVGAIGGISARAFAQTNIAAPGVQGSCGPDTQETGESTAADPEVAGCAEDSGGESQDAATGTPAISAEEAQKAAEAYANAGTASEVELENESGSLVYSVEIAGQEVTVDAMTGEVLGASSTED